MTTTTSSPSAATSVRGASPSRSGPVGVGLVGAGMISDTYLEHLTSFPDVDVVIVGNRDVDRARVQAEKHAVTRWGTNEEVLDDPAVELVVNLTVPSVHAAITSAALAARKHVWSEKPITTDRASAQALLDQARAGGLLIGVAPDTVLGPGLQTARRAIARGDIGTPLSASTVIQYPGPDLFHPSPEFLFAQGAGPLFDIGPYYLTALVHVFGPFASVAAVGSTARKTRTIQVGDRAGKVFPVEVPTHVSAIARFGGGGVAQSVFSFDSPLVRTGVVEITGTEGTLLLPDPNTFDGDIRITHAPTLENLANEPEWLTIPCTGVVAGRGTGALDMARCIRSGGQPMASGELGYHVLDTMIGMDEAMNLGRTVTINSTVDPVPMVEEAWDPYEATL